jgi:NAD+ kinase
MTSPGPENEVFSTPPSTPRDFLVKAATAEPPIRPSLSRKTSRLSSLHISHFAPDVVLDQISPENSRSPPVAVAVTDTNGNGTYMIPPQANANEPNSLPSSAGSSSSDSPLHISDAMHSPCFVHSNLDKGASLADWIRGKQVYGAELGVSKSLQSPMIDQTSIHRHKHDSRRAEYLEEYGDEDETGASLTKQLAETAVGVREMSKQLGVLPLPLFLLALSLNLPSVRPCTNSLEYPDSTHRHKGTG